MSVASRNPFDLLSDESPSAPAPTTTSAKEQPTTTEVPSTRGGQKGRTGPASRGGRYYPRGGAANSGAREQPEAEESPREGKRAVEEGGRGRGRGGRGRGDRGDRGRSGGAGRGRPFDKHSATGKTDSDRKVHQGWGGDEASTELKAEEDGSKDAAAEVPTNNDWANDGAAAAADDPWGTPAPVEPAAEASQDAAPAEARHAREEEEDNTLTLDEYHAQQKEKAAALIPQLEPRRPNDGDDGLFKDAVQVLKGEDGEAYFAPKPKNVKQRTKQKEEKVVIEIDGHFERPSRGGRGGRGGDRGSDRGSRGGGRGRGGRGRGRGEFSGANGNGNFRQVDVDDKSAFPTLA
ncbi:hypothetical protein DFH11DRAFT_1559708 [Phellopilus nigrolimitatus]|nr:hypothetical protein DFH11DRAFT_1559708 [Phellopilus nigrolimitatus]